MKQTPYLLFLFLIISSGLLAQNIQWELYQGEVTAYDHYNKKEQLGAVLKQPGTDPTIWDYGHILTSSTGVRFFTYKNVGTTPLLLTAAKSSCGCLTVVYPKTPLFPGEVAHLSVTYNTKRLGYFKKRVVVHVYTGSAPIITVLQIKGTVLAKF